MQLKLWHKVIMSLAAISLAIIAVSFDMPSASGKLRADSAVTVEGADAVWHRELSNPVIDTAPQHLYDYFTIGADAIWHRNLSNPNIDTVLSYIYKYFVVGADAVWSRGLSNPDTTVMYIRITINGNGKTSPMAGEYYYLAGTSVNITATPASGWVFSHWSGDAAGNTNPINVTMDGNKNVTANFAPQGVTLIGAIKQNSSAYDGQTVRIAGTYRGWEAQQSKPPVTRSDWAIQDSTGSLYVTGSSLNLSYPRNVGKPIEIRGKVRLKNGQPYIELSR